MRPRLKVWLEAEDGCVVLSEWRIELLQAIGEHGTLAAAARALGIPHRTAWQRLHEMEERLGVSLVEASRGGAAGGESHLTAAAQDAIQRYHAVRDGLDEIVAERFQTSFPPGA